MITFVNDFICTSVYYPPEVSSMTYCCLGVLRKEYFRLVTTHVYQFFCCLFALFSDKPEVFLPEYSQPAILHAAHFQRVVTEKNTIVCWMQCLYLDTGLSDRRDRDEGSIRGAQGVL